MASTKSKLVKTICVAAAVVLPGGTIVALGYLLYRRLKGGKAK